MKNKKFAGGFNLHGVKDLKYGMVINLVKKPNRIRIFFTKLLLGWIWIDEI